MYNNIVVGYDGSDFSKAALIEVSNRVREHGGKVTLVHAVYHDEEEFGFGDSQHKMRIQAGKDICRQAGEKFSAEYGIDIGVVIREGEPHEVLSDAAVEEGADLVAVGTRGRKGLKKLLLGSVSAGVIEKSPCDVLVVNKPCIQCTGRYASVLVAHDGSEASDKALTRACELSASEDGDVTVLYVIPRYQESIGFFKTGAVKDALAEQAGKVLEGARQAATESCRTLATLVQEGDAAVKINEMAGMLGSDLVVAGSYGWTGVDKAIIGSTAEKMITGAPCPVLVVR